MAFSFLPLLGCRSEQPEQGLINANQVEIRCRISASQQSHQTEVGTHQDIYAEELELALVQKQAGKHTIGSRLFWSIACNEEAAKFIKTGDDICMINQLYPLVALKGLPHLPNNMLHTLYKHYAWVYALNICAVKCNMQYFHLYTNFIKFGQI